MRIVHLDSAARRKFVELKNTAIANFTSSHWLELGALTDQYDMVENLSRLLRSLSFGDDDYEGCAIQVLTAMAEAGEQNLAEIDHYVTCRFDGGGTSISSSSTSGPRIYFQPSVFTVPSEAPDAPSFQL